MTDRFASSADVATSSGRGSGAVRAGRAARSPGHSCGANRRPSASVEGGLPPRGTFGDAIGRGSSSVGWSTASRRTRFVQGPPNPDAVGDPRRTPGHHPDGTQPTRTSALTKLAANPAESRMRGNAHVRFGGRRREDHRAQARHRRLAADPHTECVWRAGRNVTHRQSGDMCVRWIARHARSPSASSGASSAAPTSPMSSPRLSATSARRPPRPRPRRPLHSSLPTVTTGTAVTKFHGERDILRVHPARPNHSARVERELCATQKPLARESVTT